MKRVKFDIEFLFKASPAIIYQFLTAPACIVRWFCDKVDIQDDVYTFTWDGHSEEAELIDDIEEERLKFRWVEGPDDEYFEYRMYKSDVTGETILEITDFAEEDEVSDQIQLWESQVNDLRKECGG